MYIVWEGALMFHINAVSHSHTRSHSEWTTCLNNCRKALLDTLVTTSQQSWLCRLLLKLKHNNNISISRARPLWYAPGQMKNFPMWKKTGKWVWSNTQKCLYMMHAYNADSSPINHHSFDLCECAVSFHSAFNLQYTAQTNASLINQSQIKYNKTDFSSKNYIFPSLHPFLFPRTLMPMTPCALW